jgi:NAD-dependent SIR2 family protein deacetylase
MPPPYANRSNSDPECETGLAAIVASAPKLVVLSGAGCSTESGIPDYRDSDGAWKRKPPMLLAEFLGSERARKRYWARSLIGWRAVERAEPNPAHQALADLESLGRAECVITQNVDGLHQKAGSRSVIDLHGRLDRVTCLVCDAKTSRRDYQDSLRERNPGLETALGKTTAAPDGDADVTGVDFDEVAVPNCQRCGGTVKPDVVFFGESVPRERVAEAMSRIEAANLLLVVGSSLMVWSGYRFVKKAVSRGIPVVAVNLGKTRADDELTLKVAAPCGETLGKLVTELALRRAPDQTSVGDQ